MKKGNLGLEDDLYDYLLKVSLREPDVLRRLRAETAEMPLSVIARLITKILFGRSALWPRFVKFSGQRTANTDLGMRLEALSGRNLRPQGTS